jgi:Ni/Co efflux regulator RcnB
MKKILITIIALVFVATSFVTFAEARGGMKWRNGGNHHGWNHRGWRGNNRGYHHGYRHHRHGYWRGHRHHRHWRHYGRWYGGYWGRGVVIAPDYYDDYGAYEPVCFVRKIRRYDYSGRPYIRRVRVCE